jgi:hypothetical protein
VRSGFSVGGRCGPVGGRRGHEVVWDAGYGQIAPQDRGTSRFSLGFVVMSDWARFGEVANQVPSAPDQVVGRLRRREVAWDACMAERAWRRGVATWYPTLCIGLGQQGRSCYSIAVATSGRHESVHSDPPAASHSRTGGRRRSERVATPLRGTSCTSGFGYVTGSCLLLQDYATVTRRLAAARTARSKGAQATWPMCQNDDNSALRGPSRL